MPTQKKKLVIVEDEVDILEALQYSFESEGYEVHLAETGIQGLDLVRRVLPDLVLLDLMLPEMDGIRVCEHIRETPHTQNIPIIMLTACDEHSRLLEALSKGADDYVMKPYSPRELQARARAVSQRGNLITHADGLIEQGGLRLNRDECAVWLDGEAVSLTRTEFKLPYFLASHPGEAFTRDVLLDKIFGESAYVIDCNIDVHIRAIRKKLNSPDYVKTIRGYGYRFDAPKPCEQKVR
ncbi:MAG: response regulator [Verrucomicrobiota bacterium]